MQNSSDHFGQESNSKDQLLKFLGTSLPPHSLKIKRGLSAFIPALASLATIAVESIGSYLQKKHNRALNKGLRAIKSDQLLTWNSIKQLEDDYLLYGKYNHDSLEKIIHTIPDYVYTIKHVTEYYDMKMVTFGVNDGEELVVALPVFMQDHTRESMTLYKLETVKVPITDTNLAANSYTEVKTSKPYIALNNDYYIQLRIPELCMCKQIWHSYYCEELFLVKHKSKHSCESAIYYNLAKEVINEYCTFQYFYNTTVMPSVLDGGPQILLANILTPKRLICTYSSDMARPVPNHNYVLVNRSILCNCHMESGLTYLLKSVAFCETASSDYTMSFTLNLAFLYMIQDLWPGNFSQLPPSMTKEELSFPFGLTSNADFCTQDLNGSYPIILLHEPKSLSALHSSL